MRRYCYVYLLILASFSTNYGQSHTVEIFNDPSDINQSDHYKWVTKFNLQNLKPRGSFKNNKTHKLDSTLTRILNYQGVNSTTTSLTKSIFFLEDHQDIRCTYSRSDFESEWEPNNYSVDNYDDKGQILTTSFNAWNGDLNNLNEDDPLTQTTYFYDDDRLIEYHVQTQNEIRTKTLGNVYNYFYNEDGLIESLTFKKWSVQEDSLTLRTRLVYNYKNGLIELLMEYDNDESRGYYASDSMLYEYNHLGFLEKELWYEKSMTSDDWHLNFSESTQYDNETKIERKERRTFLRDVELFMDTLLYSYYPFGSIESITSVTTDITNLGPFPDTRNKLIFNYDSNITADQVRTFRNIIPSYEQNHIIIEFNEDENLDPSGSMYGQSFLTNVNNVRLFYSEITGTSTSEIEEDQPLFSISPNPAYDVFEIHSTSLHNSELNLQLTDVNGLIVINTITSIDIKIDISHLSPGIYIYTISNEDFKATGKLVVL